MVTETLRLASAILPAIKGASSIFHRLYRDRLLLPVLFTVAFMITNGMVLFMGALTTANEMMDTKGIGYVDRLQYS